MNLEPIKKDDIIVYAKIDGKTHKIYGTDGIKPKYVTQMVFPAEARRMASLLPEDKAQKYLKEKAVYKTYRLDYISEFTAEGILDSVSKKPQLVN